MNQFSNDRIMGKTFYKKDKNNIRAVHFIELVSNLFQSIGERRNAFNFRFNFFLELSKKNSLHHLVYTSKVSVPVSLVINFVIYK